MKKKLPPLLFVASIALILLSFNAKLARAQAEENPLKVNYKGGEGLFINNDANQIHLQGRMQTRLTYNILENNPDTNGFSLSRGEIRIDGFTLNKKLLFGFEMSLATRDRTSTAAVCADAGCVNTVNAVTSASTSGLATLNDYYVDWVPNSFVGVQVGQFKVPFLMQQLTSSTKLQFVDRSLATGFFDMSRDLGVALHGALFKKKLSYAAFAFNGDGANSFNRNNRALLAGLRFEIPIFGQYKASESDVDFSEKPQAGVGFAYAFNEKGSALQSSTIPAFAKAHHGTLDAGVKYKGFSLQTAGTATRPIEGPSFTNWGYNVQLGYFVLPKKIELAAKTGGAIFAHAVDQYEYSCGVNYFVMGHGLKLQMDYAALVNSSGQSGVNDHRVRAAINAIF